MKKILSVLKSVLLPVLVGILSGLLIRNNTDYYEVLIKPPFALPGMYFGVIWGVLYILMGIALYFFKTSGAPEKAIADGKLYFYIQLALNFLWPIVFFNFKLQFTAFVVLVILFIFVAITLTKFYKESKISGILLIPYLAFLIYAGYLNFAVWFLNM